MYCLGMTCIAFVELEDRIYGLRLENVRQSIIDIALRDDRPSTHVTEAAQWKQLLRITPQTSIFFSCLIEILKLFDLFD